MPPSGCPSGNIKPTVSSRLGSAKTASRTGTVISGPKPGMPLCIIENKPSLLNRMSLCSVMSPNTPGRNDLGML